MVRTRFAPSPTGYMHIGNLRTALYAYLYARKNKGAFLLRIEDTDQARFVEGAVAALYSALKLAGIAWDEGPDIGGPCAPYVQSERRAIFIEYAERLVQENKAYHCFCSREELAERRAAAEARGEAFKYDKHCLSLSQTDRRARIDRGDEYVIRFNMPLTGTASFDDVIYGRISVDCDDLDDMILIKADGLPTYNFANVVDDHLMDITAVIRGNEFLSSTPKYALLYDAFGWQKPTYIHLTTIMANAQRKLSKRYGDPTFDDLIAQGFIPEAVVNYIALLGWNPGSEREFFTLPELVEAFSLEGLCKSPAIFDAAKLTWMNAAYVRKLPADAFDGYARPYYEQAGLASMDRALLRRILQPRVEIFSQIPEMVDFLAGLPDYDLDLFSNKKSGVDGPLAAEVLDMTIPALAALPDWTEDALRELLIGMAAGRGMKNGTLLWPLRIALAGKAVTPGGAIEIAMLLGKEESLRRLRHGCAKLA